MDHYSVLKQLQTMQEDELKVFASKYKVSVPHSEILCDWVDSGRADWYLGEYNKIRSQLRSDNSSLDDFLDFFEPNEKSVEDLSEYLPDEINDY